MHAGGLSAPALTVRTIAGFLAPSFGAQRARSRFKQATLAMVRAQGGIVGWTAPFAALRASLAWAQAAGGSPAAARILAIWPAWSFQW
jgi:hypothetical protein